MGGSWNRLFPGCHWGSGAILPPEVQFLTSGVCRGRAGLAPETKAGKVPPSAAIAAVAAQPSFPDGADADGASPQTGPGGAEAGSIRPDQALALLSMGLMQKLAAAGDLPWTWSAAEDGGSCDVAALRHRLELTDLALRTGAPLTTAEVTYLLGARPGGEEVERGGLRARRLSRNVWRLSAVAGRNSGSRDTDTVSFHSFNDGRRRFA